MASTVSVFGISIPLYGIFYYLGIFLAVSMALILVKKGLFRCDVVYSAVYVAIGGVIGAKLLFLLVSLKQIIALNIPFLLLLKGGFVFYGGLIGGFLGLLIYCRQFHLPFLSFADLYAVVLPLGHGIGRIGCHFAGCCYGMPYDGFVSVTYTETLGDTPLYTPLFPIQLLEAMLLFLLFLFLVFFYRKKADVKRGGLISGCYAISYAVLRSVLEIFRGDEVRGVCFGLSTSQWISIGLGILGILLLRKGKRKGLIK